MRPTLWAFVWAVGCGDGAGSDTDGTTPSGTSTETTAPSTTGPTSPTTTDTGPDVLSFAEDIAPLFARSCNDCHYPGNPVDVDLTNPFDPETGIIGRANTWVPNGSDEAVIVDPGNPEGSFLVVKLRDLDLDPKVDGAPMPMHLAPLTAAELDAVETWIADGADDDAFFADEVAPIFGTEVTLRSASGRCTWCHYPGSSLFDITDPFGPDGIVGADSMFGGKIVDPGDPENSTLFTKLSGLGPGATMPLEEDRFDEAELQLVIDWIAGGALDN